MSAGRFSEESCAPPSELGGGGPKHISCRTVLGLGKKFSELPWNPVFWFWYNYATGDNSTGATAKTFNQLFPSGHKYLGFMDFVARQNIQDCESPANSQP